MSKVVRELASAFAVLTLGVLLSSPVYGQGGTTSTLSGIAVDTSGAVLPGADVTVTMPATGFTQAAVSNADGAFSFPGLNIGTYTVTVKLSGFKTFVSNNVVLTSGAGASVRATLEIGGVEEQVVVSSASEILQTQSTTISSTINTNQVLKLPLTTRSAMDFVTFLPGVQTSGTNRNSMINGLPQGMINITLDGVNIQDNTLRSTDGFFAIVSPRLDAIEEVTVTTAAQGAESAQGAAQIKFVTRSGTNTLTGSLYEYYRRDALNANTWFNNRDAVAKAVLQQDQFGGRMGGPIVIPGLLDGRNKAFFFFNYEELRQPSETTRNRNLLNADAAAGIYRYTTAGGGVQTVNLLQLAAANNQVATIDPLVGKLLGDIRSAASGSLVAIDNNMQRFSFNVPVETMRRFPTVRIDYNLTDKHRFSSAWNYNWFTDLPDTLNNFDNTFPGFPVQAGQSSVRWSWSNTVRSTLTQNIVNEARVGYSSSPVTFFKELNTGMYGGTPIADQGGFQLTLSPNANNGGIDGTVLTNASPAPAPQDRNATALLIENTLTWLKGSHNLSMGGSWTQYELVARNSALVPTISFGVVAGDPAQSLFTGTIGANAFPGASAANLTAAQNIYALLTGRVNNVNGDARLDEGTNEYTYMGTGTQRAQMREAGFFLQDSWRWKPNFTVNLGLRYELQYPFYPLNSSYSTATLADLCGVSGVGAGSSLANRCNLFQPGNMPGKRPQFINFEKGTYAYDVDYNNFAPNLGFAWTLNDKSGVLGAILGSEAVVRAGYTRAFNRNGMNDFSGQYGANPGVTIQDGDRSVNNGNLNNDGLGLPVLFRQTTRLGPAPFPARPNYPLSDVVTEDINLFDTGITVPYADTWTIGLQRSVGRDFVVEARYVGTRSRENWQTIDHNETNIFENNFLSEFRVAQANLRANIAAGRGGTFAFTGAPGTAPLPTIFAYFHGTNGNANNSAAYTSTNFTNNTFLTPLATFNPNPIGFANSLFADAGRRTSAAAAGVPANIFITNPDLQGGADLTTNAGRSDYHGLQLELRRRYAQGLQFQVNYAYGRAMQSNFLSFRRPIAMRRDVGAPGDLTHAMKATLVYDLPFGQGRRFGSGANAVVDRIIGGWTVGLSSRIQSGQLVNLGNVRLFGMSADDVQSMYKLRFDDAGKFIYMLPQDVIDETIKAYAVSATSASGYGTAGAPSGRYFGPPNGPDCIEVANNVGECGTGDLVVTGPMFQQHDISVAKKVRLFGRTDFEFRVEALNALNQPNFVPVGGLGNAIANYRVTGLTGTNTSRVVQLVARFNW
jgi:hypothetical protein